MTELVGAHAIAEKLSQLAGQKVSRWQVYRLAKRQHTPIERSEDSSMLVAMAGTLESWWSTSRFAPIFAKQLARTRRQSNARSMDEIRIFGVIGDGELTDSAFMTTLDRLGDPKDLLVLINSEGGIVSHGLAIYHALRSHPARVEVEIVGVAASMASAIAMSADKVRMAEDGLFMLHDPWAGAAGNAEDLRAAAEMLDKHGGSLAAIYARKTNIPEDRIKEMMGKDGGEGTWLNAREAFDLGFVNEILSPSKAKLPSLPAAAMAKRITRGERQMNPNRKKQPKAGARLASALNSAIDDMVDDETTRSDVIEQMATAAGISSGTVNQILAGDIDCPPIDRLEGFAEVLDVSTESLRSAAEGDGCSFDDDSEGRSKRARAARRPSDDGVSEAVSTAIREDRKARGKLRKHVMSSGAKFGIPTTALNAIIDESDDIDDANSRILEYVTDDSNVRPIVNMNGSVSAGDDDRDKWLNGLEQWLLIKAGVRRMVEAYAKEDDSNAKRLDGGEFRGFRLIDIARDSLEREGINVRGMSPREIAKRAVAPRADSSGIGTRSDFPILLENVLHKMLQAAYGTAPDQWRSVAATGSVQDFRDHPRLKLGSLPRLSKLLESGEFKSIHFPDAEKETIKAETFGNLIGLTRQAIVNDDLDGFSRLTVMLGRAAARSIEIDVFALFALNSGLGPTMGDGNALFDAAHNNIDGTSLVPSVASLEAGRVLMAQQKDPDDNDFLDLRPDVWVGPIGKGADARTAVNAEFDFDAGGANPKFRKPNIVRDLVSMIVDTPRLTGNRWYLLADPGIAPVFEVVFLEGQESPVIEVEEGFDYDGVRWKIRHDYGVGATDFRGATTNAGA